MTCKECVYWEGKDNETHAECNNSKFVDTSKYEFTEYETDNDGVEYSDHECYKAVLRTGKDFGCIHFKLKV